ncbi:MAG: FAD-dependent oxidoreductase [Acidobacteriota bacterium]|nr:FAD-dependent oxidoreductase [Acidobacteriota bacterium]
MAIPFGAGGTMTEIAILGAGMAGLGAAHRLGAEGVGTAIFEKHAFHGGHASSFAHPTGFVFDDGPHISFTKSDRVRELFAQGVDGEYLESPTRVDNYWRGHRIKHPAQCNLYGLPEDLVVRVLVDFIAATQQDHPEPKDYREWLIATYGKTFAETFPMQYGRKYHTAAAEEMTTDWLGPRLYRPELEEVLRGALAPSTPDVHYVSQFRYPKRGGFVSFLERFAATSELRLGCCVVGVDTGSRTMRFADDSEVDYGHLVSSLPLPEIVKLVVDVPDDVQAAAERLACTECIVVNVGVDREDLSDCHWTYFYDRDVVFTRVNYPHLLSPNNVPAGSGSVQAEVYYSRKYLPRTEEPEALIEPVIADLKRCSVLSDDDTILHTNATLVRYANVIFDHDRTAALDRVRGFLADVGVETCGRYGEWGYHWTDESFTSGEDAAQRVLDRIGSPVS